MKNISKKTISLALALLIACAAFAGCKKEAAESEVPKTETTVVKEEIVIATMSETPSMHPYAHNSVAGTYMNNLTYNTLFRTDDALLPAPSIVESYETLTESQWQFKLKSGIEFHNGEPLTSADVKASIELAKTYTEINLYNNSIESIEIIDELTFKINTPGPSATLLYDLCHHGNAIVPKSLIDSGNDFNKNPIGSGPYVFKTWTLGDSVTFESFPSYFDGAPAIKNMTWKIVPEGSSRTIALEAGEVDLIIEVEPMDKDRIEANKDLKMLTREATNVTWLMLNNEKPGLDNADVRHAINSAIDKESVVTVALNGIGHPHYSQSPSGLLGSSDVNADSYNIQKAKEYLEKSGIAPADVKFSIICSNDQKKRAAEVIQASLKEIGIECQIESMDLATYLSLTTDGNYTASIGGYNSSDLVSYLVGVYHTKSINASNTTRYSNPEVDALIDKAASSVEQAARGKILEECTAMINADCPQIPLWQAVNMRAHSAKLNGVDMNASGNIYFENVSWAK